jgi:hypothetical protein
MRVGSKRARRLGVGRGRLGGCVGHGRIAVPVARTMAALSHHGQEGVQAAWVEMGAAAGFQVPQGTVWRPGRPVGTVGGERVPHVGDSHDAGKQRDLLAGKAIGVALAVLALMVRADHRQRVTQRRSPPDDIGPHDRVFLDIQARSSSVGRLACSRHGRGCRLCPRRAGGRPRPASAGLPAAAPAAGRQGEPRPSGFGTDARHLPSDLLDDQVPSDTNRMTRRAPPVSVVPLDALRRCRC